MYVRRGVVAVAALLAVTATACSTGTAHSRGQGSGPITVVAAENFWGSIASQLGGDRVEVASIIDSPAVDPHDYEPDTSDGRAIASADIVLVNGVGYDTWASKLAAANPDPGRTLIDVGAVVGVGRTGNPHRWYNPNDVQQVVDRITAAYQALEPSAADYFAAQRRAFETIATGAYHGVVAQIRAKYSGTPVGASESIFAMIAPALGLDLVTPSGFLTAVSEGRDPTASDKAIVDAQIKGRQIKVYVYNSQNATPDVQAQISEARAQGIPVTTITETMTPATASWEQWQTAQLVALRDALASAAG